jgi:F420-non-reducing hydrogenase large subunit
MPRLNASDGMATPAEAEYENIRNMTGDRSGKKPVHHTLATHWARIIELSMRRKVMDWLKTPKYTKLQDNTKGFHMKVLE